MLWDILLVASWPFWVALGVVLTIEAALVSNDEGSEWATFFLGCLIGGVALFTDAFQHLDWQSWVALGFAYFVIGVLWSFRKWFGFVVKSKEEARLAYEKNADKVKFPTFASFLSDSNATYASRPLASLNKNRIVNWMLLWPLSMAQRILIWPWDICVAIYNRLSALYDKVAESIWSSA